MKRLCLLLMIGALTGACGDDDGGGGDRDDSPTLMCSDPASEDNMDQDGDGFSPCQNDCDDADPDAHPDAIEESEMDGYDQDCDNFAPIKQ